MFHRLFGRSNRARANRQARPRSRVLHVENLESRIVPNASSGGLALMTVSGRADQLGPASAFDPSGRFVVVYQDNTNLDAGGPSSTNSGIIAHFYDSLGHTIA